MKFRHTVLSGVLVGVFSEIQSGDTRNKNSTSCVRASGTVGADDDICGVSRLKVSFCQGPHHLRCL